jgi:hypothetical protein
MPEAKTYPYTFDQLKYFQKEIEEAGGVDELMIKKEALKRTNGMTIIAIYKDVEGYRQKYLIGVYESLRTNYNTEVPYVFWGKIYEMQKNI